MSTDEQVIAFAHELGIARGIVVGRLHHEEFNVIETSSDCMRSLLVRRGLEHPQPSDGTSCSDGDSGLRSCLGASALFLISSLHYS